MSAIHLEQEFPIGFAENRDQAGEETEYYVEWLDNSAEFPGLAAASTLNNANLNGGNWELLQRKELNDEDNIVEEDDEGAWSKISTADQHPLYAQVTEKNAAELQPTKRRIQPLWPLQPTRAKHSDDKQDAIDEDTYQDDLGAELIDIHKAQSRRANRMGKLRKYHDLKTIDLHVQGVFRVAYSPKGAADVVWLPHDTSDPSAIISQHIFNMNADPKAQALRYASRFSHNFKKYACKSNNTKHPSFPDNGEYSVHSPIVKS